MKLIPRLILCAAAALPLRAAPPELPAVPREFRGAWIATVGNIDWPTRGASTAQQKSELIAMLDKAAALHLNAVIFQVRPAADALYDSNLEPWSEYLTGRMGQAPNPYYDPLQFGVEEAHKRGLELHAWFNPFRARYSGAKSPADSRHISVKRPGLVKAYGARGQAWMDPGEPDVQQQSLDVILDVVRRYDVDGVHLDDYFYPYKVRDAKGKIVDFPDGASYRKYREGGGAESRADWRRSNINGFVQRMYEGVKQLKPWVKVGISPFGIWRSGVPKGIVGLDPFQELYADSRKWLQSGWVDYFTPQLYWASTAPRQSYPALLNWWTTQNPKGRNIWPGNILSHPVAELVTQVNLTRKQAGASGNVFFSMRGLMKPAVSDALAGLYKQPALVPASPWLGAKAPAAPIASLTADAVPQLRWRMEDGTQPALWALRWRMGGLWTTEIVPASTLARPSPATPAAGDILSVAAVDRLGNLGAAAILEIPQPPATAAPSAE
ncbi:MAG TPA: family 10 glycosylhydrolase [Armatimonadota bacterium]|jgi:uncharacterized lipoprotein YddW (UPF0748 family)